MGAHSQMPPMRLPVGADAMSDRDAQIATLYRQGMSYRSAAEALGCPRCQVERAVKRLGIQRSQIEGLRIAKKSQKPTRAKSVAPKCACCEVLLDQIQESSTRGLCVLCVADIQGLQRKGLLHETDLLAAALEWREMGEADLRERLWLEECADAGIEMAREEMLAEL